MSIIEPLLEVRAVTKTFPNVRALDAVTLGMRGGEVLALIGENGAGKSTLLRILSGDYQPDAGELRYAGERVRFASPRDAHDAGIRVIYQEPEIVPGVSVAENIYLGELPRRLRRFVDWRLLNRQTRSQLAAFGFEAGIDPRALGESLSPAQRQLVEIMKALKSGVKVLALDEPTSSLTREEADRLFAILDLLRREGVAVLYVSHRIREVLRLADRIAVLRDGRLVAVQPAGETSERELVRLMVGRPLSVFFGHQAHGESDVVLRVEGLSTSWLRDVSFEVRRGEVVGVAGLIGAGRTELAKALFGLTRWTAGRMLVEGREVSVESPRDAIRAGMALAPEDRKAEALVLTRSIRENVSLAILDRLRRLRFIRGGEERNVVAELVARLRVATPSIEQEVSKLSGGNQQKVVLARWLARQPRILILDEPTRGIDVAVKAEVFRLIEEMAAGGVGVVFISSELPEILGVSDRILVMQAGRITGEVEADTATEEAVLALAMIDHLSEARLGWESRHE